MVTDKIVPVAHLITLALLYLETTFLKSIADHPVSTLTSSPETLIKRKMSFLIPRYLILERKGQETSVNSSSST